jgi:hypothetical protein
MPNQGLADNLCYASGVAYAWMLTNEYGEIVDRSHEWHASVVTSAAMNEHVRDGDDPDKLQVHHGTCTAHSKRSRRLSSKVLTIPSMIWRSCLGMTEEVVFVPPTETLLGQSCG